MTHLDTSFVIDLLRESASGQPGPASAFLASAPETAFGVSVFVVCELLAGAELSRHPERERQRVRDFCDALAVEYPDDRFAARYAELLAAMQRSRQRVATMDLLIATMAVMAGAPLVTRNTRDFSRVPGLRPIGY